VTVNDQEPNTEVEAAGSEIAIPGDAGLAEELAAEQSLWRTMLWGMAIAIPICMVIWMIIVVFAVAPEDGAQWGAWLGIGAVVGVLAGAFFGGWAGFTMKAHLLDEVDARTARH
jgi:protein-S-isoprenylcysteine O-methyltransferase Ste14